MAHRTVQVLSLLTDHQRVKETGRVPFVNWDSRQEVKMKVTFSDSFRPFFGTKIATWHENVICFGENIHHGGFRYVGDVVFLFVRPSSLGLQLCVERLRQARLSMGDAAKQVKIKLGVVKR